MTKEPAADIELVTEYFLAPGLIPRHWRDDAACRDVHKSVFYDADPNPALAVCATCPVRSACLADALLHREDEGVWGGMRENTRKSLRRHLARTRKEAA